MLKIFNRKTPTIKVCMLGGKGTGKSSVLTALYKNMGESIQGTNLYIVPEDATISLLNNKHNELLHMFDNANVNGSIPPAGIAGDSEVSLYKFKFGMKDTNVSMNIEIKDFPGEKVEDSPKMVQSFIEESNAILIAIDTPHLMEEKGEFNEAKNCCQIITDFIIKYLEQHPEEHKLILFVPLKCEKYFWEGGMNEVNNVLLSQYKILLDHIKTNNMLSVCTTITPILTVGDVIFDRFNKKNDTIYIVPKGNTGKMLPAEVIYKYRNSEAKYSPENCEQPLFYLLAYIAKEYENKKTNSSKSKFLDIILKRFKELFNLIGENPEFLMEVSKLKQKRIRNNNQYSCKTITGSNLI